MTTSVPVAAAHRGRARFVLLGSAVEVHIADCLADRRKVRVLNRAVLLRYVACVLLGLGAALLIAALLLSTYTASKIKRIPWTWV